MWNTGCNVIYNRLQKRRLIIVDGEDPKRMLPIPPEDEAAFNAVIVPWANSDGEVTAKAFRVMYDTAAGKRKGWFYIYQNRLCMLGRLD
jgi:hypothetical protein